MAAIKSTVYLSVVFMCTSACLAATTAPSSTLVAVSNLTVIAPGLPPPMSVTLTTTLGSAADTAMAEARDTDRGTCWGLEDMVVTASSRWKMPLVCCTDLRDIR